MWSAAASSSSRNTTLRILSYCRNSRPPSPSSFSLSASSFRFSTFRALDFAYRSSSAHSNTSGGWGRGRDGGGRFLMEGGYDFDKIDSLGRLMVRILRHTASDLKIKMRSDGYVKVRDLLKLDFKTLADIPLSSHTIDDVRETVRMDKKQRYSLVEENGELLIRANQGHSMKTVDTESLSKPIISAEEVSFCAHGTYRKYLDAILEHGLKRMSRLHVHFSCGLPTNANVTSGMRHDVNVLIFLDVKKAMEEGMKFYFSENKVILTEGFNGVVPVKYFEKIESWPSRRLLQVPKGEGEIAMKIQNIGNKVWPKAEKKHDSQVHRTMYPHHFSKTSTVKLQDLRTAKDYVNYEIE